MLEPGFVIAAATNLSRGVELLAMYAQDRLVAIIPTYRSNRLGRLPVPTGTRTGWQPPFLGEPPIAPGFGTLVGHAIIDELSRSRRSWLRLNTLDASGDFGKGVQAAARTRGFFVHRESWSRGYATRRPIRHTSMTRHTRISDDCGGSGEASSGPAVRSSRFVTDARTRMPSIASLTSSCADGRGARGWHSVRSLAAPTSFAR